MIKKLIFLLFIDYRMNSASNEQLEILVQKCIERLRCNMLDLSKCGITDELLEQLIYMLSNNLEDIHCLNLSENAISDPTPLSKLRYLTKLNLSKNKIATVKPLKYLRYLRELNLSSNNISNINALKNLVLLYDLDLSKNNIVNIDALRNLERMSSLNLFENPIMNYASVGRLRKLSELYITCAPEDDEESEESSEEEIDEDVLVRFIETGQPIKNLEEFINN